MNKNWIIALTIIGLGLIGVLIYSFYGGNKSVTSSSSPTISDATSASSMSGATQSQSSDSAQVTQLQIQDIKAGTGKEVKSGDTITVNYTGTLLNGTKFDSSYDRNQPFTTQIGVGQVIKGWDQGIVGMKVGGVRKLTIPASLAYGSQGQGPIPPNSPLIFQIELLDVK